MSFKVLKPGLLTTLQDLGRQGFQHLGITEGGPMDEHAFRWANALLNNPVNACAIEVTYGGLELVASQPTMIAITGGDLGASLNGEPLLNWSTHAVKAGDKIVFRHPVSGLRSYLSVADGFAVKPVLGSCSTVLRETLGGLNGDGAPIKAGDELRYSPRLPCETRTVPLSDIPNYREDLELGVIPGYQFELFSSLERRRFFGHQYEVTNNIDRMGYRLKGAKITAEQTGIISEGIALGAIQIPADGQPIILMRDRQTIGGYPKIGTLTALDVGQLSQRSPGATVRFCIRDISYAQAQRHVFDRHLKHLKLADINQ